MADIDFESTPKGKSKDLKGFFKYVFDFNEDNKNDMLNMIQYTVLTIIPLLLVLKTTRTYVPEVDENKGTVELLAESIFQIVFIVLSFWFTHRIIAYIPTYSGIAYRDFNETCFILPFMFLLLTLQTKLGDKLRILSDRFLDLLEGKSSLKREGNTNMSDSGMGNTHQPSQADALGMSLGLTQPPLSLPHPQMTNIKSQTNEYELRNTNYNNGMSTMRGGGGGGAQVSNAINSMLGGGGGVSAASSGMAMGGGEPMAANEMGGMFGSTW
jgi:hypothetical protein